MLNTNKEQLEGMKVAELRAICKENGIKHYNGKNRYTKQQMINAILEAAETAKKEEPVEDTTEKKENKVKQKMDYVENIKIGTLVAFKLPNGKVKSAKVEKKSTKNRKLKLVTSYGAEFIIPYDSVIWVRTGTRWPKGVYNLLKGKTEDGERKE